MIIVLFFINATAYAASFFSLADPPGDDYGPGYYVYPENNAYKPGSFDILGFDVVENEGFVRFKIELKKAYVSNQNIEIYIDKDHVGGSGNPSALPGRRANIAHESFWEKAVLITPLPELASKELKRIAPDLVGSVIIPKKYWVSGNQVICDISTQEVGVPTPTWGYVVAVTPSDFERPNGGKIGLKDIGADLNGALLIREVQNKPGKNNFGGGDVSGMSSNIIDVIVPSGESQEKVLRGYNSITRTLVTLTGVYPPGSRAATWEMDSSIGHYSLKATILGKEAKTITIDKGEKDGIYIGRIGVVIDEYGDELTNVVVDQVFDTYSVCKILKVSMLTYVTERMEVRFK